MSLCTDVADKLKAKLLLGLGGQPDFQSMQVLPATVWHGFLSEHTAC